MKTHSSAIIEDVINYIQGGSSCVVAYFYFDFKDAKKQKFTHLIRSLLRQLSRTLVNYPHSLVECYSRSRDGQDQPTVHDLLTTLRLVIQSFQHVFIIIDALDECTDPDDLLYGLAEIVSWKIDGLHILATSRQERQIEDRLIPLISGQIKLESRLVGLDIQNHVHARLQHDARFKKWTLEERDHIEAVLLQGANGM